MLTPDAAAKRAGGRPQIGLVLGAGGIPGLAFHAGVLSVLEVDLGWDARDASVIVGTSAGALAGGLLRSGLSATDLAAVVVGAAGVAEHPSVRDGSLARDVTPGFSVRDLAGFPRLPPVRRWLTRPLGVRMRHLAAGVIGDGRLDLSLQLEALADLMPHWPDEALWVCAARYQTLERFVFGRTSDPEVEPSAAIAASCAVPGVFAPVKVGRERYVDGGVHSPTNADLLEHCLTLDAVVVVSPLTGAGSFPGLRWAVRQFAGRLLARELARLSVPVLLIEPTPVIAAQLAISPLDDRNVVAVIRESFLDAHTWLHDPSSTGALEAMSA